MIFVDTSAWYVVYSRRDRNHRAAVTALKSFRERLVTSDFIVDETLTLLRARNENRRAVQFGENIIELDWVSVVPVSEKDFASAWNLFREFGDKQWSFTDCTSRAVMQRLGINRAFAFDDHFRQFGTVTVVP